jgi:hypothetical protein
VGRKKPGRQKKAKQDKKGSTDIQRRANKQIKT